MAFSYAVLFCLPFIAVAYFLIGRRKDESLSLLPPGPKKWPIIGHLHLLGALPHRSLWQLSRKHGPLMLLQLGNYQTLIVSSAVVAKEVLKNHDLSFCSRPRLFAGNTYSYGSIDVVFSPYGAHWRELRKFSILELLSLKKVADFRYIREEEVSLMIDTIAKTSSTTVNLSNMVLALSNNIICRVAMGKKYKDGEHEIVLEAQAMLSSLFMADYIPSLAWVDRLVGTVGRLEKNVGLLDNLHENVIKEHLDRKPEKSDNEDIVDVLLRIQQDDQHLTRDVIKGILTDVFIAGTDTTSATLVWAMTELIRKPILLKKAQNEVREAIGSKGIVEESDLHNLHYLKSVVKETLRLRSVVPLLLPRETMTKCTIGGYDIMPKTRVFINAWGIARDPEVWEDAEEFLPERFMDGKLDFKGHDFQFIPFGSGRRICPAINMGIATIELALANLLYAFEWELPVGMKREDIDLNETPGITVHKKCPLHLVATKYIMK